MSKTVRIDIRLGVSAVSGRTLRRQPDTDSGQHAAECLLDLAEHALERGDRQLSEHLLLRAWQAFEGEAGII